MSLLTRKDYNKNESNLAAVLWVISPFFILDWLEFYGRYYDSKSIGHFACDTLPFSKISGLLFPHTLIEFAQNQCVATHPQEPALSIIFYMLKIAIVLAAGTVIPLWIYIIPGWLLPPRLKQQRANAFTTIIEGIEKSGGIVTEFKRLAPFTLILLVFCFFVGRATYPRDFQISLIDKIMEDCMALTVFITTLSLLGGLSSWIYFSLKRINLRH